MNYCKIKDHPKGDIIYNPLKAFDAQYEALPAGCYKLFDGGGFFQTIFAFRPLTMTEKLIAFKTGVVGESLAGVAKFLHADTRAKYKSMGIAHKMAYIFYGPPGTGKTCTALLLMEEISKLHNAICLDATGQNIVFIANAIAAIKGVQDNPIVIFQDEVEKQMKENENSYLTFLDGADSQENVFFLGCTNYLNKISRRITDRRSRIKKCLEIKALPLEIYKQYIAEKAPSIPERRRIEFAFKAEEAGLVIDELKHALLDHVIDDVKISDAITEAKAYSKQEEW